MADEQSSKVNEVCMKAAIMEARRGLNEGGIPIGSVLLHRPTGEIVSLGRNQRLQKNSAIHHAEMNCLENLGRKAAQFYRDCTLFSTLSPCAMCSGAIVLYGIRTVVLGENQTFKGEEDWLTSKGVTLHNMNMEECKIIMREFIEKHSDIWNEDIGE